MSDEQSAVAKDEKEEKKRPKWPKKFRNFTTGPLTIESPTHGVISLPGKGTVWLHPADLSTPNVQRYLEQKKMREWDDETHPPETLAKVQEVFRSIDRPKLDADPLRVRFQKENKEIALKTFSETVKEGIEPEVPQIPVTLVTGDDSSQAEGFVPADSGPPDRKKKRG